MLQLFSRPDLYIRRAGRLDAAVSERRIPGAPPFMRGLRAVFVTDTHVLPRTSRADIDALAAKIAGTRADVMLLGGDYSDRTEDAVRLFDALGGVVPALGGYGVLGNNDTQASDGQNERLETAMARAGCQLLVNRSVRIRRDGGVIWIGGVDEHRYGKPDATGLYPGNPRPDIYRILLSHYAVMPSVRPDLMLCGHTHGGQFNLLGVTPFTIGFEERRIPYQASMATAGLFDVDGMKLLVSKGVGASRIQLRVGVRPEINLLVFE